MSDAEPQGTVDHRLAGFVSSFFDEPGLTRAECVCGWVSDLAPEATARAQHAEHRQALPSTQPERDVR